MKIKETERRTKETKKEMELLRKERARLDIAISEVRRTTQYTVKLQMFVQCEEKIILISVSI